MIYVMECGCRVDESGLEIKSGGKENNCLDCGALILMGSRGKKLKGGVTQMTREEAKKKLHHCRPMNAWITMEQCAKNQEKAYGLELIPTSGQWMSTRCLKCEDKINKNPDIRVPRKKICKAYEADPRLCVNADKGGVFVENLSLAPQSFHLRKHCCTQCSTNFQKWKRGEFK